MNWKELQVGRRAIFAYGGSRISGVVKRLNDHGVTLHEPGMASLGELDLTLEHAGTVKPMLYTFVGYFTGPVIVAQVNPAWHLTPHFLRKATYPAQFVTEPGRAHIFDSEQEAHEATARWPLELQKHFRYYPVNCQRCGGDKAAVADLFCYDCGQEVADCEALEALYHAADRAAERG